MATTLSELPTGTRLIANPNIVLRVEDDNAALLFDPDTGAVRIINFTGVAVWKLVDGTRDLRQIMAALEEQFDGMGHDAQAQVEKLLNDLYAAGAVGYVTEQRP